MRTLNHVSLVKIMEKEELEFASNSFEDQQERLREFGNETREVAVKVYNKVEALEAYIKELVEALQNNKALPPAYGPPKYPPKYPPIKTKEECEKKGGKWDEETKTCKFPPKKKETTESQLAILPSLNQGSVEAQAMSLAEKIGRR